MIFSFSKLKTKAYSTFRKLVTLRASPKQIATGFAIGVFIGIFPTFGFGALVIFAIAARWRFNVPSALIGTILGNPLFSPLWIGLICILTGISPSTIKLPDDRIISYYSQIGLKYLIGNFAVSMVFSLIFYFIVFRLVIWYRKRKGIEPK